MGCGGESIQYLSDTLSPALYCDQPLSVLGRCAFAELNVDPSGLTVAEYLEGWLDDVAPAAVGPKALERYRGLYRNQIKPHLGSKQLQKLRPADVSAWLQLLRKTSLSVRSVLHARGVLVTALAHVAAIEIVERNLAAIVKPPKLVKRKAQILEKDQIIETLGKLEGHSIYPIAALAIGTGTRRGEIAALRWDDIDLDAGTMRIERALEQHPFRWNRFQRSN